MGSLYIAFVFKFLVSYERNLILSSENYFPSGNRTMDPRDSHCTTVPLGILSPFVALLTVAKQLKEVRFCGGLNSWSPEGGTMWE